MGLFIVLYLLLLPSVALYIHAKHSGGSNAPLAVGVKAWSTALIVLAALVCTAAVPAPLRLYAVLVTAGLVFGLIGDVVICQPSAGGFLSGMIFFALGHLCYIGAFAHLSTRRLWAIPVFVVAYLPVLVLLCRIGRAKPKMRKMLVPCAVYAAIIITMLSLAVTMAFSGLEPLGGVAVAAAGVLFVLSDSLLAYQTLKYKLTADGASFLQGYHGAYQDKGRRRLDAFTLYCYYIGQSLFALSVWLLQSI